MILLAAILASSLLNPQVTQATIASTICVPGWTKSIRPSTSVTNRIKRALLARAGVPASSAPLYELDHRIPLELGGSTLNPGNLWLQPWSGPRGARAKDVEETRLKRAVCSGAVALAPARECMHRDWTTCRGLK